MNYHEQETRRQADEQIRAYVGERLAQLSAAQVDALSAADRALYDRLLLRCEFLNQPAFHTFIREGSPQAIAAVGRADELLKAAADELAGAAQGAIGAALKKIEAAFDKRDAAMPLQ